MIKDIVRYPTPLSLDFAADVRAFDAKLFALIDDLQDTINANNLQALSAFQIGSNYNVIVFKKSDGTFVELINPRLISQKGRVTTEEKTVYYDDVSATITRFDAISIIYQDITAKDCSLQVDGELSVTLQRKLDYSHGATFLFKLSSEEREVFLKKLEDSQNIGLKKNRFISLKSIIFIVLVVTVVIYSYKS